MSAGNIEVVGFEAAEPYAHMIEWLRRGEAQAFVVADASEEITRQQPGSRLLKVDLVAAPDCQTQGVADPATNVMATSRFTAIFPLVLTAVDADGQLWRLSVRASYDMTAMDTAQPRLQYHFTIDGAAPVPAL